MRTCIYIEDGVVQLVITPETEWEKKALNTLVPDHPHSIDRLPVAAEMMRGSFYDCRGGWIRQTQFYPHAAQPWDSGDNSLILRVPPNKEHIEIP